MHARTQSDIAAWLAIHSFELVDVIGKYDSGSSEQYWTQSKIRINRWHATLKIFEQDFGDIPNQHQPWQALDIVIEEILISEMLTRIWSAILVTTDDQTVSDTHSGLAYSIFIGHIEVKNRALRALLNCQSQNPELFDRINRLRRNIEKWTDVFLSWLPQLEIAQKFAFDRQRIIDYSRENECLQESSRRNRQTKLLEAMSATLIAGPERWGANPETNRKIVFGILAVVNREQFDVSELPQSMSNLWLEKLHHETEALVRTLAQMETVR